MVRRMTCAMVLISCVLGVVGAAKAQSPEDATRRLWDTAFAKPAKSKKPVFRRRSPSRAYRIATPQVPVDNVSPDTVVGITVWRLRPASRADAGERIIVHDNDVAKDWLPQRISANTRLAQGDRIRISVEAARTGYLYVIDREQYADGSLGEPYLIFPTTRTLEGNNQVTVGKLIEIPAQDDSPPYFTVRRTRPDHVAEAMSVLISPVPLEGVEITGTSQKLSNAQVAAWENAYSVRVGFLEMAKSVGQAWTKEEKDAGAANTRALTAQAPAPHLLFYRAGAKPNEPVMVKVHLWYGAAARRTNH
jgi:hypothetical protein